MNNLINSKTLSRAAQQKELLAIALRRLEGVPIKKYPVEQSLYNELLSKGWISLENGVARLTPQGLLFYDSVAEAII